MKLTHKNEIFSCLFEFSLALDNLLLLKVFVLINKYYPSYKINYSDFYKNENEVGWESVVINTDLSDVNKSTVVHLTTPIYFQKNETLMETIFIENGLGFFYGFEESSKKNSLGVDFYANLYTNVRYACVEDEMISVDQSLAATKNRFIMTSFLKELEILLEGNITEFESPFYLDEKFIFKYGIKEEAILKISQD